MVKKLFLIVGFCFTLPAYAVEWLSYTINVNQHQLHYYQGGSGTPVFLLTGYATTSNFWSKPFVECLANKHTVYLLDYWGINTPNQDVPGNVSIQSMADDSFMLAKTMKAKSPVFIGWSMGGAVVQQIGFSYADDIKKAVLISPLTINNQPAANALDDELPHPLITYNDVLNYVFDNNLYKYRKKQLNYYKSSLFASHERLFPGEEVSENQVIAMNDWATSPATLNAAKKSEAEYLFMIPNQDKMLLPSKTLSDALLFKHAKVVKFDGSGHDISLQAPDEACSQIEEFI